MDDYAIYGDSVFESFRMRGGRVWRLDQHLGRLTRSCDYFGLDAPQASDVRARLRDEIDDSSDRVVRLSVYRTGGRWRHAPVGSAWSLAHRPFVAATGPISLALAQRPLVPGDGMRAHKTGSRLAYQSEWNRAQLNGFDDVLFYDTSGQLLETAISNIAFWVSGTWLTPPLELGLLPGLMRSWLLDLGVMVERRLSKRELAEVQGALLLNTVQGCRFVKVIGKKELKPDLGVRLIGALPNRSETRV